LEVGGKLLEVAEEVGDVCDDIAGRQDELEPPRCQDVKRSARQGEVAQACRARDAERSAKSRWRVGNASWTKLLKRSATRP
jgi:hypothetical protein